MQEDYGKRIRDLEAKVARLEERQEKDFAHVIGLTFSFIRPIIAVLAANLQNGKLSVADAVEQVTDEEPEADRKTIESWAGIRQEKDG